MRMPFPASWDDRSSISLRRTSGPNTDAQDKHCEVYSTWKYRGSKAGIKGIHNIQLIECNGEIDDDSKCHGNLRDGTIFAKAEDKDRYRRNKEFHRKKYYAAMR